MKLKESIADYLFSADVRGVSIVFVALFSILFGVKFFLLSAGNPINAYPYVSPDGFDWYTEGVYLVTHLFDSQILPSLPVLRPPLFVLITATDYLAGGSGLVLSIVYALAIMGSFYFTLKIIESVSPNIKKMGGWYIIPVAIATTIYPMNFARAFILADTVCISLALGGVYFFADFLLRGRVTSLIIAALVSLLAGLTQTYGLIPFAILCLVSGYILFCKERQKAFSILLSGFFAVIIYVGCIFLWRHLLPHKATPENFTLIKLSADMLGFYIGAWGYYLLPFLLFFMVHRGLYIPSGFSKNIVRLGIVLVGITFLILGFFYQWADSRFTSYLWPWLVIAVFTNFALFKITPKEVISIVTLMLLPLLITPESHWQPSSSSLRLDPARSWIFDYFQKSPIDRGFDKCIGECVGNEFLSNADKYTNSVLKVYLQIVKKPLPPIATKFENKIVHRPWSNGSVEDGWYFVYKGQRRWIADAKWLDKNGYKESDNVEISADELNSIPIDPMPLTP